MRGSITILFAAVYLAYFSSPLRAADGPPIEGTMMVGGRNYKLAHVVAYETKTADFELVTVLASNGTIPVKALAEALKKNPGSDDYSPSQPYFKITFLRSGEPQYCQGWADNTSFSTSSAGLTAKMELVDGRVRGEVQLEKKGTGSSERNCNFRFNVALGLTGTPPPSAKPAAAIKPTVSGKFTGNGKPAKLAFVSARPREGFNDKPALLLLFTEKDHSKDPKPDMGAAFGKYGSALIISISTDGGIFGCEVAHMAHAKKPFSSVGNIHLADFELDDNRVQGKIATDGEQDTFDQKWEVDLKFAAPLAAQAKSSPSAATPQPNSPSGKDSRPSKSAAALKPAPASKPALAALNVHDLALPKDATNVDYKALVEQMTFTSPAKVQSLAGDLSKRLAEQGWTKQEGDLINAKSAIMRRARGDATLTIMVKPEGEGSKATIFTEGLIWDEK